jgi:hypothetical protein
MGYLDYLSLVFIALKLTGHIDWSWWWVLFPAIAATIGTSLLKVAGCKSSNGKVIDRLDEIIKQLKVKP